MKFKLFLEDLFKNGLEPNVGDKIYCFDNNICKDTQSTNPYYIRSEIKEIAEYGGKVDEKTFYTSKGTWSKLWIKNCFVYKDIIIK